jgi:hypothetical protein
VRPEVALSGTVEILEDVKPIRHLFRAIGGKHGREIPPDAALAAGLIADDRVLLAITPSAPPSDWTAVGLDEAVYRRSPAGRLMVSRITATRVVS